MNVKDQTLSILTMFEQLFRYWEKHPEDENLFKGEETRFFGFDSQTEWERYDIAVSLRNKGLYSHWNLKDCEWDYHMPTEHIYLPMLERYLEGPRTNLTFYDVEYILTGKKK